jgi:type VI secretion system protein ImpH
MAAQSSATSTDVERSILLQPLQEQPGSFDFFQSVRLLKQSIPEADQIHFHANPQLAYPPAQIADLQFSPDGSVDLTVNFFGLVGPLGVLPYFYSELVRDRARAKDLALSSFFDIFHQRLLSLFHQAWQKQRFWAEWEQTSNDGVSSALQALLGIRTTGLQDRQHISDASLSFYTGLLALQTRPAVALEQILSDYFQVPAEVQQFRGAWYALPESNQCRLGNDGAFEELGMGAVVGDAIWNLQSHARIVLGPMRLDRFQDFLPAGQAHREAEAFVEFFAGRQFDFELQLVLDRTDVPLLELGSELPLGWCSWLKTDEFEWDPGDAILPLGQQLCM